MSRWLGDFWFAYKQHPISALMLLAALILTCAGVSAAYAIRHDSPVSVYQSVTRPAQGQTPTGITSSRGLSRPTCLHGMPLGAADSDSSNSWFARHCLTTPTYAPTAARGTGAGLSPSPRSLRSPTASPSSLPGRTANASPPASPSAPATIVTTAATPSTTPPPVDTQTPTPSNTPTGESS